MTKTALNYAWNSNAIWDNDSVASAGNDYFVINNLELRTAASVPIFGGDSLTLGNNSTTGTLHLHSKEDNNTITITDLTLNNGILTQRDVKINTTLTVTNGISLTGNGTFTTATGGANNGTLTVGSSICGDGALAIYGDRVWVLGAKNTFTGGLTIGDSSSVGKVTLGALDALGAGVVTFGGNNSTLDLAGYSATILGLSSGSVSGSEVKNSATTTSTLTINTAETSDYSFSGTITGEVAIIKEGYGTQTFNNVTAENTMLNVTAGTANLSNTTIATLTNSGTINLSGTNVITTLTNNGTLGISGTNTFTELTMDENVNWTVEIRSADDYDKIIADSVTFNSDAMPDLLLSFDGYELSGDDSFPILTATTFSMTGSTDLANFDWESLLSDSYHWNLAYTANGTGGTLSLSLDSNAIPEPATWTLLILGATALVFMRRKR